MLRSLLRLLLQKPSLAATLPLNALPINSAEARAVKFLCETIIAAGEPIPAYAALLERLRGNEDGSILSEAAAELMQQPFAEGDIDAEFEGALKRLQEAEHKRIFGLLQEKVAKLGVSGLSSEEKRHYVQALSAGSRSS